MYKLVKNKTDIINSNIEIGAYVRLVKSDYILLATEEDCTCSKYINYLFNLQNIDYRTMRFLYKYLALTFEMQDNETKNNIVTYCAIDMNTCIEYWIGTGMSLFEATNRYINDRAYDVTYAADCCYQYSRSGKLKQIILTYLPMIEVERFYNETKDLFEKYEKLAYMGKKNGDVNSGIIDFIYSEFDYTATGLVSYTLNDGCLLANFVTELNDILYFGNYEKNRI